MILTFHVVRSFKVRRSMNVNIIPQLKRSLPHSILSLVPNSFSSPTLSYRSREFSTTGFQFIPLKDHGGNKSNARIKSTSGSSGRLWKEFDCRQHQSICSSSIRCSGGVDPQKQNSSDETTSPSTPPSSSSTSSVIDSLTASSRWRKGELSKITQKFHPTSRHDYDHSNENKNVPKSSSGNGSSSSTGNSIDMWNNTLPPIEISHDDDVPQMWKDMESRVTNRRSLTLEEALLKGKKVGRNNIRKTDEETWLQAGLYDEVKKDDKS